MAPEEERRGGPESGKGDFDGTRPPGRPAGRGGGQADCRRRRNLAGADISEARCAR